MELQSALKAVLAGKTLDRQASAAVIGRALSEDSEPLVVAGLLSALAQRGETVEEITGAVQAMHAAMVPFEHEAEDAIDTCGTGGDGLGSFNLSTATALVACAAGAKVIKHGNRSVSSKCGSADLLEAAGLRLDLDASAAASVFEQEGITFLFAPGFHPAMKYAAPIRKSLGVRTIFNYLGPLSNPGRVRRQLLGVNHAARVADFAEVLAGLGHERAYVVHGAGGADELTLAGVNQVLRVGEAPEVCLDARELGLMEAPVEALAGGDARRNLALLQGLLRGETGPIRDAVLLNTTAALLLAGVASSSEEGLVLGKEALDSGAARRKLESWSAASRAQAAMGRA